VLILNWLHADLDTILFYGTKIKTFSQIAKGFDTKKEQPRGLLFWEFLY